MKTHLMKVTRCRRAASNRNAVVLNLDESEQISLSGLGVSTRKCSVGKALS